MKENNYLVSIFVNGKCVDLFFSEDLCELYICRMLYKGCEIEVYDMRSFLEIPSKTIWQKEHEAIVRTERNLIPEQVVCLSTKRVYSSLDECAKKNGISRAALMDTITGMTVINGQRYCFAKYFIEKEKRKKK